MAADVLVVSSGEEGDFCGPLNPKIPILRTIIGNDAEVLGPENLIADMDVRKTKRRKGIEERGFSSICHFLPNNNQKHLLLL